MMSQYVNQDMDRVGGAMPLEQFGDGGELNEENDFDQGADPYALEDPNEQDDPEKLAFVTQDDARKQQYDLNFNTQIDMDSHMREAEIEQFVDDSNMYNLLQEEQSEIRGQSSDAMSNMSQGGYDQLDHIKTFYGSNNASKQTHTLGSSQMVSKNFSRNSSASNSKSTIFGANDGTIGEGGMSIRNYIDKSRDLSNMLPTTMAALNR